MSYFTHPLMPRGVIQCEPQLDGSFKIHQQFVDRCDKIELLKLQPASIHSAEAVSTEKA